MQGKTVVVNVLIMSMVLAQIQVEAAVCCPSSSAKDIYNECRYFQMFADIPACIAESGCKIFPSNYCPSNYPYPKNSGDAINDYCKLGCVSSVCGALNPLQNSDASEIVNEAAKKCVKACSTFCTKGSKTAVESA